MRLSQFQEAARGAAGPSDTTSSIVGCAALLLTGALIVGLVACARRMRHPDASRKCYLAYIFFTCGWLLYAGILMLSVYAKMQTLGACAGVAVFAVLGLTGIVMAILGLVEIRGEPGKKGRAPAIVTLALAAIMLAGFGIAIGAGAVEGILKRGASFTGHGFTLRPPGAWNRIDPSRGGPNAVVGYSRSRPEAFLRVLVYRADPNVSDLRTVAEGIKGQNSQGSPDLRTVEEGEESFSGRNGWTLVCEMTGKIGPMIYWYWLLSTESRLYMLVVSGPLSERAEILSEGRKAFETFRLDPSK